MPRATITSSNVGVVPRSIVLVIASGLKSSAIPSTMISSWIPMSPTTSIRIRDERVVEKPRMLRAATYPKIPSIVTISTVPSPNGFQNAPR